MKITEALGQFAAAQEMERHPVQGGIQVPFGYEMDGTALRLFLEGSDEPGFLQCYAYVEMQVPRERVRAVGELISLVNPSLRVGCFELVTQERVRFRHGMFLQETTPEGVEHHVELVLSTLQTYLFALVAVMHAGAAPHAALPESFERDRARRENQPLPTAKPTSPWLVEGTAGLQWQMFRGTGPIQAWATGQPHRDAGILLVGPAEDACEDVARLAAASAQYRFARLSGREVERLPAGALQSLRQLAPVMVYLGSGSWQLPPSAVAEGEREKRQAFHEELLGELQAFNPEHPVVFVTAVPTPALLEGRLAEVGAFDRLFAVPEPLPEARGRMFLAQVGEARCGQGLHEASAKVGKVLALNQFSREGLALAALALRRLHDGVQRPLEFLDLLDVLTRGLVERADAQENPEEMRWTVAIHEAGHAAMAVLDSDGHDVPEFSTIVPTLEARGLVVASTNSLYATGQKMDYVTFRHLVRVSLAGRAAEELVFGPGHVSSGAATDLEQATRRAFTAFSEWGFAPGMVTAEASRSNLAVTLGAPAPDEVAWTRDLVRRFLAEEYGVVLGLLAARRPFLEAVAQRLLVDPVVDQGELTELCVAHGVRVAASAAA